MNDILERIKSYYRTHKIMSIVLVCLVIGTSVFYWYYNQEKDVIIPLSEAVLLSQSDTFEAMVIKTQGSTTNQQTRLELTLFSDATAATKDLDGDTITVTDGETIFVDIGGLNINDLLDMGFVLPITYSQEKASLDKMDWVSRLIPLVLMIGLLYLFMGGYIFTSTGKKFKKSKNSVMFSDIGGLTEVKESLKEVVSFINEKDSYKKTGAIVPRGILLIGSPGTGKTLLAQAIATEADVPFYYTSGSEFHNMWVGLAALRVKRLFKVASKAPSVVFIDEFDSIAHTRGQSSSDAGREWNHTLNQLLSEMDGFKKNSKVIVIAATNRADVLDPAVTRAGRFDRKITILLPNYEARKEILTIHSRNKPLASAVSLEAIAKQTSGFSGADLALVMNEAAIQSAKEHNDTITMSHLTKAIDKVLVGDERKGYSISQEERKLLAYHEAGHAVVSSFILNGDKVERITILPHSIIGGYTRTTPETESLVLSKSKALGKIAILLGGRVAEEIVIGDLSSGSQNDLKIANELAHEMVKHYGMGEHFGLRYSTQDVMGREKVGVDSSQMIDTDINGILTTSCKKAEDLIKENREILDCLAFKLLEVETLDSNEIDDIIRRKKD